VVVVEPTGAETQVFSRIAGVEISTVFRDRLPLRPGEMIRLRADALRAHLFDAASGVRIAQ
jgi:multiple sugar transport system ATP-binding protein